MNFNSSLLGEFMDIKSFIFYTIAVVLGYLLTTPKYTQNARVILYLILTLNFIAERCIIAALSGDNVHRINWWKDLCRQFSSGLCVVALMISVHFYRDYSQMNHKLLTEMNRNLKIYMNDSHATQHSMSQLKSLESNPTKQYYWYKTSGNLYRRTKHMYPIQKSEETINAGE